MNARMPLYSGFVHLHAHGTDGDAHVREAVDEVVIGLRLRKGESREHRSLRSAQLGRRVSLVGPTESIEEDILATPSTARAQHVHRVTLREQLQVPRWGAKRRAVRPGNE